MKRGLGGGQLPHPYGFPRPVAEALRIGAAGIENFAKFVTRHGRGAQRQQVPGDNLAVEQVESVGLEQAAQPEQGHFRRVAAGAEHRFAKKDAADCDAVYAADEFRVVADFDGMRPALIVQARVGAPHVGRDPRALGGASRLGTGFHDLGKRRIEGKF